MSGRKLQLVKFKEPMVLVESAAPTPPPGGLVVKVYQYYSLHSLGILTLKYICICNFVHINRGWLCFPCQAKQNWNTLVSGQSNKIWCYVVNDWNAAKLLVARFNVMFALAGDLFSMYARLSDLSPVWSLFTFHSQQVNIALVDLVWPWYQRVQWSCICDSGLNLNPRVNQTVSYKSCN